MVERERESLFTQTVWFLVVKLHEDSIENENRLKLCFYNTRFSFKYGRFSCCRIVCMLIDIDHAPYFKMEITTVTL